MDVKDAIRVEQFRQLRKEIRGSEVHLIVGVDVGKDRHSAFFGTATGRTLLRRLVFGNDMEGFEKLLRHVELEKLKHSLDKVVFGLEPTADYHKPLAEFLIKGDHEVVLVSGTAVKHNREMLDGRWDKNDTKDPANIADLISQGKFMYFDYPSPALRDLRNLLALRTVLKKQEHRIKVRIRNHLLAQYFPELEGYYRQWGSEMLCIVRWCLNPSVIAGLAYDDFLRLVAPGCKGGIIQKERLRAIWKRAVDSIGCDVGQTVGFEAKVMVEQLQQIKEAIRATDAKTEEICLEFPEYFHLRSIPGFGPTVSAKVLAAIGNPFRFDNERQVLKLAGWDLSASRSGKRSEAVTPVISNRGKADLRYALYQAANVASSRNKHFVLYFANKLRGREREKGIRTKMKVKLAAKLLILVYPVKFRRTAKRISLGPGH
jgi:transposase